MFIYLNLIRLSCITRVPGSEIAQTDHKNVPSCSDLENVCFSRDSHVTCNVNQVRHINSSRVRQWWRGGWWPTFLFLTGLLGNTVTYSGLPGRVFGYFWVVDFKQKYVLKVWEREIGRDRERKEASILGCAVPCLVAQSYPTLYDSMDSSPMGSPVYGDSPGKNTGVGFHALL